MVPDARSVIVCMLGVVAHEELIRIGAPRIRPSAERFGFDLDVRTADLAEGRLPAWGKAGLIQEHLGTHDVVIRVDADTLLVDERHDLSLLPTDQRPLALVGPRDHDANEGMALANTGVMAIRSCDAIRDLFDRVWGMTKFIDHKWWENAAFLHQVGYAVTAEPLVQRYPDEIGSDIRWLDVAWNSHRLDPSPAPIIKHYPGMTNEERVALMRKDIEETEPAVASMGAGPGTRPLQATPISAWLSATGWGGAAVRLPAEVTVEHIFREELGREPAPGEHDVNDADEPWTDAAVTDIRLELRASMEHFVRECSIFGAQTESYRRLTALSTVRGHDIAPQVTGECIAAYRLLLGREPDAEGYLTFVADRETRPLTAVLEGMLRSHEAAAFSAPHPPPTAPLAALHIGSASINIVHAAGTEAVLGTVLGLASSMERLAQSLTTIDHRLRALYEYTTARLDADAANRLPSDRVQ
jgi:hypothetical protein